VFGVEGAVSSGLVTVTHPESATSSITARITSPIAGRIVRLGAAAGDTVKAGDVLAMIDAYRATRQETVRTVEDAVAEIRALRDEWDR
jgi:multidrug efflux pump subunit AcrA (membrane-fusion protein)